MRLLPNLTTNLLLFGLVVSCKPVSSSQHTRVSLKTKSELMSLRASVLKWAPLCTGVAAKENCDIGDALLFNGLLCLSGEEFACRAVKLSQGGNGRVWRAPQRVENDAYNSFSRDMALGALAYLVKTHDKVFGERWFDWISKNNNKLCEAATDNRCNMVPGFLNLYLHVWLHLQLKPAEAMLQEIFDDESLVLLQTKVAPPGFELHLLGVNLLIRSYLKETNAIRQEAAQTLAEREPLNPFFRYLWEGRSETVAKLIMKQCPSEPPQQKNQWYFERAQSQQEWRHSMGWDCIMLINLLTN